MSSFRFCCFVCLLLFFRYLITEMLNFTWNNYAEIRYLRIVCSLEMVTIVT